MELLCNSANGSVVGYTMENGRTNPLRYVDQDESDAHYEFVGPFQDGVLLAAKHWQTYIERYVVSSNELHKMALHIWDTLRSSPDGELVDVYLRAPQQDLFGYGDIFKRNQYPSLVTIFLSPILTSRRRLLIEFIRRVQWSEAIEKSKNLGYFHRKLLFNIFLMANFIGRSRFRALIIRFFQ
jgi:hypothetical protein